MCLAIPGQVCEIFENHGALMGKVNFGGITKTVCLEYVPDIAIGEYTIVHVGFALNRIDEESARQTLKMFEDLGMLSEELGPEEEVAHEVHE